MQLPESQNILLLSPHWDDAVLSAFSVISASGEKVDLVSMCGGVPATTSLSGWDALCGFPDPATAAAARMAEDQSALNGRVASRTDLPILDGGYSQPSDHNARRPIIRQAIHSWLRRHTDAEVSVLLPAGAGVQVSSRLRSHVKTETTPARGRGGSGMQWARNLKHRQHQRRRQRAQQEGMLAHADHLALRDHTLDALDEWEGPRPHVVLYEELPYSWSRPADAEVARLAEVHHWRTELVSQPVSVDDKAQALAAYESQLRQLDPSGRLEQASTLPPQERFWIVTPSAERSER